MSCIVKIGLYVYLRTYPVLFYSKNLMDYIYGTYSYLKGFIITPEDEYPRPPELSNFEKKYSLTERIVSRRKISRKHGENIVPIILEPLCDSVSCLPKTKLLTPCDSTLGKFIYSVKVNISMNYTEFEDMVIIDISGKKVDTEISIKDLYQKQKKPDGFLYLYYYL
jgi:hypothetical protein